MRTIIEHLVKLAASLRKEQRAGWRRTVRMQQGDLADALTPSIRLLLEDRLDQLHAQVFEAAGDAFETEEPVAALDPIRRWPLAAILGEADDPLRS